MVSFKLNGKVVEVGDAHPNLLAALREELNVTSTKDGCSPSGQCGCCAVLIDGKAKVSCQTSLEKIANKSVVTLEGFEADERDKLAGAFAATGSLQCGFCTPGILVRTKSLLDSKGSSLDRDTAARHLGGHLCRCTGYVKILDAVENLAQSCVAVAEPQGGIGARGIKYEANELALGDRGYVDDLRPEGLAHGALALVEHARAEILSLDTSAAAAAPGVVGVYTAADVAGQLKIGIIYEDWPVFIPVGGRSSYLGDVLAIVVAETRQQALEASELVKAEYKVLEVITDPGYAVSEGSPDAVWGLEGNVLSTSSYVRGDVAAAVASAAHVVSETFHTQRIEHAFLEPESTLAEPRPDGGLHVYSGGQGVWDDRNQIAKVLDISIEEVSVELVSNGGAFGGKEDMSNQAQTALAAFKLQRPVRCTLTRSQSFLMHPKRHPIEIEVTAACDETGKLVALHSRMLGDSGPYASVGMKVLERAAGHASGPYVVPNIDVLAVAARTNNPVCGAFRGFGANQAQFAMEGMMDRLSSAVGISGWEMRNRNLITPGDLWGPGQIMDDGCLGARACLDAVRPAYDDAIATGHAVGLGVGIKNSGLGNGFLEIAKATVRFDADGGLEVRHCWTEMGQGIHTVALQVAVEELGVDPAKVTVVVDTTRDLGAGQTTGSRGTLMGAGSVKAACEVALAGGCEPGIEYEGEYRVDWTSSLSSGVENPIIHSTFGYAAQVVIANAETGVIEKVVAAHDVGRAVNPMLCEGQVEGAVHMGLGYALSEEFPTDDEARPTKSTLKSLGIIRPKDMPDVDVILIECPEPNSPYGIKGVGEIGLVPTAGAVAQALHQVDGQWRNHLPMAVHQPVSK